MYSLRYMARHAVVCVLFVLAYLLLNQPEVILLARIGFVAWYPATGLVMAVLLGLSPWYALAVAVANIVASKMIYGQPLLSFTNTVGVAGNVLCYGGAAYLLRGWLQIDLGLRRRRDVVHYVWVGAVAAAGGTLFGVGCLLADHSIAWNERVPSAIGWILGDSIGLVGVAPFLLVHIMPYLRRWALPPKPEKVPAKTAAATSGMVTSSIAEVCGQAGAILFVLWVMFGTEAGRYDHFYLGFIPIIWTAMRQGVRRVVTALLALNFGIVVAMQLFPPTAAQYTKVASFMLVQSAVGLIVGSEVSERHRLAINLNNKTSYLNSLIQNSPLGIAVLDQQANIDFANPAFERLFQHSWRDLPSIDFGMVEAGGSSTAQIITKILAGESSRTTVRCSRKDGKILDLAVHGVPLKTGGEVTGAYLIYEDVSEQVRAIEAQRQHAQSLDNLVKELELRTQQMTYLSEMGSLLECSATIKEASAVVSNSVQKLFPESRSGSLYLFKSSRNIIEAVARWGQSGVSESTFQPDACWSLRRGRPHWTDRAGLGVTCLHLQENSDALCLCIPMIAQGNTLGTLHLEFDRTSNLEDPATGILRHSRERLAVSAASQIALSLASLQLRETLREQSIRDPLTRLFNRRFLEESLERELQLAARKKQPLTVLFLDLDHFKNFNDTFGHEAGDSVLQALGQLFSSFFRATDICCRYGGEEFAIILPESSAHDACIRADALRAEVKNLRLQYMKQPLGPLSISIGVATFPDHASSSDRLLAAADRCLYESKARGRDRVTVAGHQPASETV